MSPNKGLCLWSRGGRDRGFISLKASMGKASEQGGWGWEERPYGGKGAGAESKQRSRAGQNIKEAPSWSCRDQ